MEYALFYGSWVVHLPIFYYYIVEVLGQGLSFLYPLIQPAQRCEVISHSYRTKICLKCRPNLDSSVENTAFFAPMTPLLYKRRYKF